MLWCRFKPRNLEEFGYNPLLIHKLENLVSNYKTNGNLLNMAFYGTKSSGKLTLCRCLLASMYGDEIHNLQEEIFTTKQNCTPYNIKIKFSKYHYEISFCGLQYADKGVLVNILDKYFSTMNITTLNYKILVIKDFDTLSEPAQFALRRKIETNSSTVRFIFLVKNISKVEKALISRLLTIRCRRPYVDELKQIVDKVCNIESIDINSDKKNEILKKSNGCISKVFFYLEQHRYVPNSEMICPEEKIIDDMLSCLKQKDYPGKDIRDHISKLLLAKIDQNFIFYKVLSFSLVFLEKNSDKDLSISEAARLENISQQSNRFIICFETYLHTIFCLKNNIDIR